MRGRRRVCQNGISDGQEDGRNRGGLLYSDRRSTVEGGAVRCQLRGVGRGGMGVAVTVQQDEDQVGGGRREGGGRTSPNT